MRTYNKQDIDFHNDGGIGGPYYPAVNVKCYTYIDPDKIIERFHCSEKTAERAAQFAWDMHAETFWECAGDDLGYYFSDYAGSLKVYSAGRSGGWLIVEGLPSADTWDAIMLARWRSFEKAQRAQVAWLCGLPAIIESIEANEWAIDADTVTFEIGACLDLIAA